jgi:hypothetical protein
MAWTKKTVNGMLVATEVVTLPASATIGYTSEIDFLKAVDDSARYISVVCTASAISGTNVDVSLHGTDTTGGTKFTLVSDTVVADITNSAKTAGAALNLAAYPAPYYYIGLTADADESANTMTVVIMVPQAY